MTVSLVQRGDVLVVDFSVTYPRAGKRPCLVVQNDQDNARMQNTIVCQITTNISRSHEDTQILVDKHHPDWSQSGLRTVSKCSNIGDSPKVIFPADHQAARIHSQLTIRLYSPLRCIGWFVGFPGSPVPNHVDVSAGSQQALPGFHQHPRAADVASRAVLQELDSSSSFSGAPISCLLLQAGYRDVTTWPCRCVTDN